jgi:putative endonuclease
MACPMLARLRKGSTSGQSSIGARAERAARRYLERRGQRVVCTNYRTRFGEIDLVMHDTDMLVFVEVRFRRRDDLIKPEETVDAAKRARLIAAAEIFIASRSCASTPCRFDVVSVTRRHYGYRCNWIKDAFHS